MADYKYTNFNVPNILGKNKAADRQEKIDLSLELNHYRNLKEQGKPFVVEFTHADKDGNQSTIIKGVEIFMPYENISFDDDESEEERKYRRAGRLVSTYEVSVVDVDEENTRVIVEYRVNRVKQRQQIIRKINDLLKQEKEVHSEINKEMRDVFSKMRLKLYDEINASGQAIAPKTLAKITRVKKHEEMNKAYAKRGVNRIVVDALVRKVYSDGAMIDIKGYGIAGYLPAYYWGYTYVSNLKNVLHEGDVISVVIIGFADRVSKEAINTAATKISCIYLCARTPLIDNPWENLKLQKGDIIKVTCTYLERTHWFGTVPGYDMEIFCEYPDSEFRDRLPIVVGNTYECFVKRVNKERLMLTAKPFLSMRERHE